MYHRHTLSFSYFVSQAHTVFLILTSCCLKQTDVKMKSLPVSPARRKVILVGAISMAISPSPDTPSKEAGWSSSWLASSGGKACTISVIMKIAVNSPTTLVHFNTQPKKSYRKSTQTVRITMREKQSRDRHIHEHKGFPPSFPKAE